MAKKTQKKILKQRIITITKIMLVILAVSGGVAISYANHRAKEGSAREHTASSKLALAAQDTGWSVGELRENGLRIVPLEPSDAARVLDPNQFSDAQVKRAYWIATRIPEVLNQLYCWCGCENRGVHRSNLACFEDLMGVDCDVCQGTAEIAYEMVQQGITDAGKIQAAVDAKWGPKT